MQSLGQFTDTDLNTKYNLYFGELSEIKGYLSNRYGKINSKDFISNGRQLTDYMLADNKGKIAGLYHNNFILTQGLFSENPLLLDGFTRLFVAYDEIKLKEVFVKDYIDLSDEQTMRLLSIINFWKTTESFVPLFDRGFCLLFYLKTGYNIKEHVNENLIGYFDKKSPLFYRYDWRQVIADEKLLLNNPMVFKDMLSLCRLYDLKNSKGYKYAVQFYMILRKIRTSHPTMEFDTDKVIKFVLEDKHLDELGTKLNASYNVTSKESIMTEALQYLWNKFIRPVFLNLPAEQTLQEKKKEFQKNATKAKKGYKQITYNELLGLPKNTMVYEFQQYISTFEFKMTEKKYMGYDIEKSDIMHTMGPQKGKLNRIDTNYVFKFKDDKGNIDKFFKGGWLGDNAVYIKK